MDISDLHCSRSDSISNDELVSAHGHEQDRYIRADPSLAPPQAMVVSGDSIQAFLSILKTSL